MKETKYNKINWWELPSGEFYTKIDTKILSRIYANAINICGSEKKLILFIKQSCQNFQSKSISNIKTHINQILNGTYQIQLSLLYNLIKIVNMDPNNLNLKIHRIVCRYFKEYLPIKFPLFYDEDFAVISEIIRSEGNISKDLRSIQLANSDTRIINQFLSSLSNKFNIDKNKAIFSLYTKIAFSGANKEDIRIKNSNGHNVNFFLVHKRLKNKIKEQIQIMDYDYSKNNVYFIKTQVDSIKCKIKIPEYGVIETVSNFTQYKSNITSSLHLRINNKTLTKLLHYTTEIQKGKKSHLVYIPKILKTSPDLVIKKAFEVTFKCEGNIDKDQIRIKSISSQYLAGWQNILNKNFSIVSNIYKDTLAIANKHNFIKFYKNFKLLKEERNKIKLMLNRRDKLPQGNADTFYLLHLKNYGALTSKKLAEITNRTQACTKKQLTSLYYRGLVNRKLLWKQGGVVRYEYFIEKI